jgi:threonine synthase
LSTKNISLHCEKCQQQFKVNTLKPILNCVECNNAKVDLLSSLTHEYINSEGFRTMNPCVWKYIPNLIPNSDKIISLNEGGTPLRLSKIGTKVGSIKNLRIKDETRNPTGTFLDRGTTTEISAINWMTPSEDSRCIVTGILAQGTPNPSLAISLAAYSARGGFECELFVPKGNEWKLTPNSLYQLISYGAKINFVSEKNFSLPSNYYYMNTTNPIFIEGLKTIGFEIFDQLEWKPPDHIIVPIGSGKHLYAIDRSIKEMSELGLINRREDDNSSTSSNRYTKPKRPMLHGVTVAGSAAASRSHNDRGYQNREIISSPNEIVQTTIAPELALLAPSYLEDAMSAINDSGGSIVKVHPNDLINAVSLLASQDGIFASSSGASSVAALLKLSQDNIIQSDQNVVCIVTGSGIGISNPDRSGIGSNPVASWKVLQARNRIRKSNKLLANKVKSHLDRENVSLGKIKRKILLLLNKKPDYAYSLRKRLLNDKDLGKKTMDISTLYQHLNELENLGMIVRNMAESFRGKPIRFYYKVTERGKIAAKI